MQWRLNGHVVCKAFYKVPTCMIFFDVSCVIIFVCTQEVCAIPTKMFDSVVNEILLNNADAASEEPKLVLPCQGDIAALGFLDAYFRLFVYLFQ